MGIYEGIKQIRGYQEEQAARKAAAEEGKINWIKIANNETVKVWFLQEIDRDADNYIKGTPIGIMATEHTNPDNWQRKAVCTAEEGACLGCEKHREDWKAGWRQKSRLYINVLVERQNGDREVAVMSQANGTKSVIAPLLLEYAVDENTVTDRWWKIYRSGERAETSYLPRPGQPSKDVNVADYQDKIFDLRKAIREVPYEEQFDFYFSGPTEAQREEIPPATEPPPEDEAW